MGDVHMCEGNTVMETHAAIEAMESHGIFLQGLILHLLQQRGFTDTEWVCLSDLYAVQICLLLKAYRAPRRGESTVPPERLAGHKQLCN